MSQRDITDFSAEAQHRDLRAVVDALALKTFDLWVPANSAATAVAFAVEQPERVAHIIFSRSWASGADLAAAYGNNGIRPMMQNEYELYCDAMGMVVVGNDVGLAGRTIEWLKNTPVNVLECYWLAAIASDISASLPDVQAPAFVYYRGPDYLAECALSEKLAAGLRYARYLRVLSPAFHHVAGDTEAECAEMRAFLTSTDAGPIATMPEVQYATTSDGVRIAYTAMGQGRPFVLMTTIPWSHLQIEWDWPEYRAWLMRMGRGRMLISYDGRGLGLSQRDASDFSIEAQARDLRAVVDALHLSEFDLWSGENCLPAAVRFVQATNGRVRRLVLTRCWANGPAYAAVMAEFGLRPMMRTEYDLYCDAMARVVVGYDEDLAKRAAEWLKSTDPEVLEHYWQGCTRVDVTPALSAVCVPALVTFRGPETIPQIRMSKQVAEALADARYIEFIEPAYHHVSGDIEPECAAIDAFLSATFADAIE